jgi:uroporphyrinogen decarboxylase
VRESDAWVAGLDIPLTGGYADVNVSSAVEYVVKGPEELERLQYLLQPPSDAQLADFRGRAAEVRRFARQRGVLVEGGWVEWGEALLWLLGVEGLIFAQVDDPGFVEQLLEMLWRYERRRIEILLDAGVDVVVHRGWYHVTDFWSPRNYRRFLKPLLKREIEMVHQAGALHSYIMTKSFAQHYDDFLDLGIDILWGVDPVEGGADLAELKRRIGHRVCLWGGMNSFVTLGRGTEEEIRGAVREAVQVLAPGGGFVLFPVDQITPDIPRRSVEILIDEWRRLRDCAGG